jgi:hypothetical protein
MTNASAGLRQQHGYHRCFYRRMFKVSIQFTVKIWFGANAATMPDACSFRPSTFCNSWRNAFNYNRAVSNRNEIVEKSPHAKYAAAADNPALNLCRDNFCRDADTAFDRARNRCRTPDTGQYAPARRTLVYCARKRIRSCREMEGGVQPQPARNGDDTIYRIRKFELSGSCRSCVPAPAGLTAPVRRRHGQAGRSAHGSSWIRARRLDRGSRWRHGMFADRSKGRMPEAGGHGAFHDIAKKSVQLPIVHCGASE